MRLGKAVIEWSTEVRLVDYCPGVITLYSGRGLPACDTQLVIRTTSLRIEDEEVGPIPGHCDRDCEGFPAHSLLHQLASRLSKLARLCSAECNFASPTRHWLLASCWQLYTYPVAVTEAGSGDFWGVRIANVVKSFIQSVVWLC